MIKSQKLKSAIQELENVTISNMMKQLNIIKEQTTVAQDTMPNELVLDAIIQVSQDVQGAKTKKAKFIICDKWLKPNNVFSIVAKTKQKKDSNVWILFYDSNTWYIRKGLKAASTVHVKLISKPEQTDK